MNHTLSTKTRINKVYYAPEVSMHYSFDSLADMAQKQLGSDLQLGDVFVCDNKKGDKRKGMQWTKKGFVIVYIRLHNGKFEKLSDHAGQVKKLIGSLF